MHARPERLWRIDLQMVGRSDQHGGHSEIASRATSFWESERKDNLAGVYEISGGTTTTSAFLWLKVSNIVQKAVNMTIIYAENEIKERRS